jgi:outer membrane protein OmpA-like peptidoglycan-associated protein
LAGSIRLKRTIAFGDAGELPVESLLILAEVAELLLAAPPTHGVEIRAFTDNRASEAESLALSQRRAEAVRDYLVRLGVDGRQLTATGYGTRLPLVPNTNERNRTKNHRIEFVEQTKAAEKPSTGLLPDTPPSPPPAVPQSPF